MSPDRRFRGEILTSSLYRESLLGLCGYEGSPERLSELPVTQVLRTLTYSC